MKVLVVTNPFAGRALGDRIADPAEMKAVLAGEHAGHVVAAAADEPAARAKPTSQE